MLPASVRKFLGNIIGGFVPNHARRLRTRVWVAAPMWRCMRFVHRIHGRNVKIEKFYGAGGKSLVLGVDKKYVYKFSCQRDANKIALREKDIVDYFKHISPLPTPDIKLLKMGRELVRRYDYVSGTALSALPPDVMIKNANKIGKQIAKFLFEIAQHDPDCLKKYKTHAVDIPRPFYGWNHEDWDNLENFIIDKDTLKIIAVIDWENTTFGDFYWRLYRTHRPEKRALFDAVHDQYLRLYNNKK